MMEIFSNQYHFINVEWIFGGFFFREDKKGIANSKDVLL
jgi:hypothetical protein